MSNPIDQLLALKTWAVVGLSNNSERAAYRVSKLLIEKGHQVVPVHPKAETVHGQQGYAKLSDIPFVVDAISKIVDGVVVPIPTFPLKRTVIAFALTTDG